MKRNQIIYYVSTGLLSLLMLFSASMYIFQHEVAAEAFTGFGFPTWILYPLAIAKILGVIAIWYRKFPTLREWAYAGFCFDFLLAIGAHVAINDGQHWLAVIALVLLFVSYFTGEKSSIEVA